MSYTPEEIAAACQAAVERHRARGGVVPDPPDRAEIPPRVPVVLGPAPDRYCLATCYCGRCDHYVSLDSDEATAAYARLVREMRAGLVRKEREALQRRVGRR